MKQFFDFAHKRHTIYLRRKAEEPWPWSDDPILNKYRFTNVYRELDATTVWFRRWVREPNRSVPEGLLATVLFRWINRSLTGEAIFRQVMEDGKTPWEHLLETEAAGGDLDVAFRRMHDSILNMLGSRGPFVTGAFVIKSPDGYEKLPGILKNVQWFMESRQPFRDSLVSWREMADIMLSEPVTLRSAWEWVGSHRFMGEFMAYEVVTDLRHTDMLCRAPDIMTWANPGPGAKRGLDRVHGRYGKASRTHRAEFIMEMRELLDISRDGAWPNDEDYPPLEMRDIEHTLCEFDKYERTRTGEGRPRGVFRS